MRHRRRGRAASGLGRLASGLVASLGLACSEASVQEQAAWMCHQGLFSRTAIELQAPGAQDLIEVLGHDFRARFGFELVRDAAGSDLPRLILATIPQASAWIEAEGVELLPQGGFRYRGRDYVDPADGLFLTRPDPERPGLPLTLCAANAAEHLPDYLRLYRPAWTPRLRVFLQGERAHETRLLAPAELRAESDRGDLLEVFAQRQLRDMGSGVRVHAPAYVRKAAFRRYARMMIQARRVVLGWWDVAEPPPVEVFPFDQVSSYAEHTGCTDGLWSINPVARRVHVLVQEGVPHDGGAGAAAVTALTVAGPPAHSWLAGAAGISAARSYWGRPIGSWVAHLHGGGLQLSAEELFDPAADQRYSPHRLAPLRAFLLHHIVKEYGRESLQALWRGEEILSGAPKLEATFLLAQSKNAARFAKKETFDRRQAAVEQPLRRGVALLGDALSPDVSQNLWKLSNKGARAASLTLSAFVALQPPIREGTAAGVRTTPGDLGLLNVGSRARARDIRVLLEVQPLSSSTSTWADANALANRRNTERFFAEYERIAEHTGLLAELCGFEIVCLGSELELMGSTWRGAERLQKWRGVIARFRASFSGALTFAARTVWEVDQIDFWDDLDFIGAHLFPTLPDGPSDAGAAAAFAYPLSVLEQAGAEHDLPVLIVQTGFPSADEAVRDFSHPLGDLDLELQHGVLFSLVRGFSHFLKSARHVRGIYLYGWGLEPDAGGVEDRGFALQGKPAEGILWEYFHGP